MIQQILLYVLFSILIVSCVSIIGYCGYKIHHGFKTLPFREFLSEKYEPLLTYVPVKMDDLIAANESALDIKSNDENVTKTVKKGVVGYFHVCMMGSWKSVLEVILKEFKRLHASELFDSINVVALGNEKDLELLKSILKDYPVFHIRKHVVSTQRYERETLELLWQDVDSDAIYGKENYKIFYFHSKGVSKEHGSSIFDYIMDWVRFMMDSCLRPEVLKVLNSVDVCGSNLDNYPVQHFSGNFWWANSSYISKLPFTIGNGYYDPEFWICKRSPSVAGLARGLTPGANHYKARYPSDLYVGRKLQPIINKLKRAAADGEPYSVAARAPGAEKDKKCYTTTVDGLKTGTSSGRRAVA